MPKGKKRTSVLDLESNETMSLIIAVITTTVIFAYDWTAPLSTIAALPLSFLAVLTAFLFHELAHRFAAKKLNCSTAPVYSTFSNMAELQKEVMRKAIDLLVEYTRRDYSPDPFLNMGVGVVLFSKENNT